jgi:flagellar biogenesis protein FliO
MRHSTAEGWSGTTKLGGLAGWILSRLGRSRRPRPSLALLERVTLAPRQSLALVEADGRRFLVATSAEGSPAFYALDRTPRSARAGVRARVSW